MHLLETLTNIVHIFACFVLIIVVLLQSGKGGGMGALGGAAAGQIFGGQGAGNFLTKFTTAMAVTFMSTSLLLSYIGSQEHSVLSGNAARTADVATTAASTEDSTDETPMDSADTSDTAVPAADDLVDTAKKEVAPAVPAATKPSVGNSADAPTAK